MKIASRFEGQNRKREKENKKKRTRRQHHDKYIDKKKRAMFFDGYHRKKQKFPVEDRQHTLSLSCSLTREDDGFSLRLCLFIFFLVGLVKEKKTRRKLRLNDSKL